MAEEDDKLEVASEPNLKTRMGIRRKTVRADDDA